MTIEEHIKKLTRESNEFKRWYENVLPDILGVEAVNFYVESFENEGFTDEILERWQEVKRKQNTKRPDRAAASRKILTGATGDLGRSIEYEKRDREVVITSDTLGTGSDKDYASAHNEGTTNAGRNHSVTIPKRQFIGKSAKLNEKIIKETTKSLKQILK